MNIESEGEFCIQQIPSDFKVVQLFQHQQQLQGYMCDSHQPVRRKNNRQTSEPSLRRDRDDLYSERAVKRGRERGSTKVVHKFEKNLRKNREKAYILMLQNKVQSLEKEISKLKAINRANQQYIRKISASEQIITGTFIGRNQIYQRMQALIQQSSNEDTRKQMIKQVSTLRYRLGVHGKDRIKAINYYFKQILQAFIPQCQKFLIYTTCENFDFYRQSAVHLNKEDEQWRQQMLQDMNMNEQAVRLVQSYKPAILEQKRKYDELVQQFYNTKQQLMKQAKNLEKIFDSFRRFLNPFQLTKILVNIEKNKYRKEMTMDSIKRFWTYEFHDDQPEQQISFPNMLVLTGFDTWA